MRGSMVDIQSATAENTRGKKEDRRQKIKETTSWQNVMSAVDTQGGHKQNAENAKTRSECGPTTNFVDATYDFIVVRR